MSLKSILSVSFVCAAYGGIYAQNLDSLMAAEESNTKLLPVTATFKTTRLVNLQTIEQVKQGELDFRITHRFDDIAGNSGGITTLYGFDNVTDIRIAFDYGVKDWWTVGFGRSKGAYERRQIVDLNSKIKLVTQKQKGGAPISASLYFAAEIATMHTSSDMTSVNYFKDNGFYRVNYVSQLLLARKFGSRLSIILSPTFVYRNLVNYKENNATFALGAGIRYKFTKRMGLIVDYFQTFDSYINSANGFRAPLGVGIELETGGHVFHLLFSNNSGLLESQYITANKQDWAKGQFRFGFNISRVFTVAKRHDD
jgi:hypothetical protein